MKNTYLTLTLIAAAILGLWYLVYSGTVKLPQNLQSSPVVKTIFPAPMPTPILAPQDDIDSEMNQTNQDLDKTNPDDFSGDALLDINLGL